MTTTTEQASFSQVFADIAHHFFPDGCPEQDLQDVWPCRTDRRTIPSQQAKTCLATFGQWAAMHGVTRLPEWRTVLMVALATLPGIPVAGSPLVDGSSRYFCSLLKSLGPGRRNSATMMYESCCTRDIMDRLLAAFPVLDVPGRCTVFQFVTLWAKKGCLPKVVPQFAYTILFQAALQPETCVDAVRLLLLITCRQHVCTYRTRQVRAAWDATVGKGVVYQALYSLWQLYTRLGKDSGHVDRSLEASDSTWCCFPDAAWERNFMGGQQQSQQQQDELTFLARLPHSLDHQSDAVPDNDLMAARYWIMLDPKATQRWRHNLPFYLYEQWYNNNNNHAEVISSMASFVRHTSQLLPEMQDFLLLHVLPVWDHDDGWFDLLYDLIPALQPQSFAHLRTSVLQHLERWFVLGRESLQYMIVSGALANLIQKWDCQLETTAPDRKEQIKVLYKLIHWTDDLLLEGFLLGGGHLLCAATIDFFGTVCELTNVLAAPSSSLLYRLLLSTSSFPVDRACKLLVQYKTAIQKLKARNDLARVQLFNCFLWDFCTVLWRGGVAINEDLSILFTDVRPSTRSWLLSGSPMVSLSLTHGAVFSSYATDFLAMTDNDNDLATLKGKLKVQYLDYLKESCGLVGIYDFLHTFVASLAQRRRLQQSARSEEAPPRIEGPSFHRESLRVARKSSS